MATLDELLSGKPATKKRVAAPAKTNVEKLAKNNQTMRTTLAVAGESDPSANLSKPTALDRIFGVLDAAGTGVRAGVNNITNGTEADLSITGEMGKALRGEKRVQGSDIIENFGVDNKWAQMLGGLAVDIALDPVTYLSFGLGSASKAAAATRVASLSDDIARGAFQSADEIAELTTKYGDDVVKMVSKAAPTSVSELDKTVARSVANSLRSHVAGEMGERGGVKFMGQSFGGQGALNTVSGATKDVLSKVPGSEWFERAFINGDFTDITRSTNELMSTTIKANLAKVSGAKEFGRQLGKEQERLLEAAIPDKEVRNLVTIGIGRQFGSLTDQAPMRAAFDEMHEAKKAYDAALKTKDAAKIAKAAEAIADKTTVAQDAMKSLVFDPAAVRNTLTKAGYTDTALLDSVDDAVVKLQDNFAELTAKRGEAGMPNWTQYTDAAGTPTSQGYVPGMPVSPFATKTDDAARQGAIEKLGLEFRGDDALPVSIDDLTTPKAQGNGASMFKPKAYKSKDYLNAEARMVEGGLATELDIARLAGAKTAGDYADIALRDFDDAIARAVGSTDEISREALDSFMTKTRKAFTDDDAMKGFLKAYDRTQNTWKVMATSLNIPRFQLRNGFSNKYLLWTEGLFSPKAEQESAAFVAKLAKGGLEGLDDAERAFAEEAIRNGIFQNASNIAEQVGAEGVSRTLLGIGETKLAKFGGSLNEIVENQSRLSGYIAAKAKGLDPESAGRLVDTALYNYSPEMKTAFERNVMKRLIPFYTWTRSNTPHMATLLFTKPGKLTPIMHAKNVSQDVNPIDTDVMPAYLRGLNPISLPFKDKGGNQIQLAAEGLFPIGDLERLAQFVADPKGAPADVVAQLSPLLKTPLELIFDRDLFYGDPVERYAGETRRAPGYIEQFDDIATQVPGLDGIWGAMKKTLGMVERTDKYTGDVYLAMPAKAVKALKDLSPWTNSVGKMLSDNPKRTYDTLSYLTGLKLIPYDTERFGEQALYEQNTVLRDAVRQAKDNGKVPEKSKAAKKSKVRSLSDILQTGGGN